mgnify:CR=1 FL=1
MRLKYNIPLGAGNGEDKLCQFQDSGFPPAAEVENLSLRFRLGSCFDCPFYNIFDISEAACLAAVTVHSQRFARYGLAYKAGCYTAVI